MIAHIAFLALLHSGSLNVDATELRNLVGTNNPCGNLELCLNSTEYRREIRCQCDPDCSKHGDCCRDSPFFRPEDTSNKLCKAVFNINSTVTFYVSMVGSCPSEWQDPAVRQACQYPKILGNDPLLSGIPMTDTSTAITLTYRNYYCAVCNNADLTSLQTWRKMKLQCSKVKSRQPTGSKSELINRGSKWILSEKGIAYPCYDLMPILPPNYENLRRCPPHGAHFSKCNDDWQNTTAEMLCKSYTAYVFRAQQSYQNAYCAQCRGLDMNQTKCYPDGLDGRPITGFSVLRSFQELLDFEFQVSCDKYEVYDPFTKRCRRLFNVTERIPTQAPNDCAVHELHNETYILSPDNQSVWLPASGQSYRKNEFFFTEDNRLAVCFREDDEIIVTSAGILTYIGLGISIIFLILHLCAVVLVAELRNLSGRTLASLCVSLICGYSSFIIGGVLEPEDKPFCAISSVAIYYFFLSAFTWMLVIGFDVWRALVQAVHFQSCRGGQWRRFFAYSAFAWLTPAIMTTLAIAADNAPSDMMNDDLRPGFGRKRCWFTSRVSLMIFFGAPLTLIMILNVGFFTSAAWMTMGTRPCGMSAGASGARRDFRLYLRLAVMVGLTWVFGLLANVLNYPILWFAFMVLNTLQGLFIFVMFTCTAKVFRGLEKAMPWTESFRYSRSSQRGERGTTKTQSLTEDSNDTLQDGAIGSGSDKEQNPKLSSFNPKFKSLVKK